MIKLRFFLLFVFVFLNTKAQNQNPNILDSLKITQKNIKNLIHKVNPIEFSKLSHQFIKKLNSTEKRYKQTKKKKNLQKKKFEFDIQEIYKLKAKNLLNMMYFGFGIKENKDSLDYYRNEILSITNDKVLRSRSYGFSGWANYILKNTAKSIEHYTEALQILEFPENKNFRQYQIRVILNLNTSLLELNIIEEAQKNYNNLEKMIQDMSSHIKFKNYKELLKIEKALILIAKKDYEKGLKTLKKVNENNIDNEGLKHRYYFNLHITYLELKNYSLGEYYFDKAYPIDEYKDDFYFLNKLRYAIGSKNIEKADLYYSKIEINNNNASSSRIISNYFILKKDFKKAVKYLNQTLDLDNLQHAYIVNNRLKVFTFYNDLSKELSEMKRLNEIKDQQIIENKYLYIKIGFIILSIIFIIFAFSEWAARKRRYLYNLSQTSKKTILEAKGQFLENMSHEIRTPITSILGYLSLLKEENLILEKRLNYTNSAISNTNKMMNTFDNFLNLTSLEDSSGFKNIQKPIKVTDFINDIKATFLSNLEIKNMKLYLITNAEDSLVINYDLESLTIIVNNLISNAIKYSNSETSIYLSFSFTTTKLQIKVKDEGFGISENEKNNVFSRFYQSTNEISNGGFGIGLSLVNNLIKKLNGTISLETELGVGSVFKVELPITIDNYDLNTSDFEIKYNLTTTEDFESVINVTNNFPKALIVDDNTEMIIFLKEVFSSFLDCTFAFNGKEALKKIKEQSFEIIISDLRMPVMNGIDFKQALDKEASYKEVPFIFMTSTFKNKINDLDLLGFDDFIKKPFNKDEIISRVQYALEKTLNRKKLTSSIHTEIEFESSSSELIQKIKNCILENITNPDFNVVKLAETCGYGQKKLNEILKSKIGLSIVNTILEIRLLKAYDLIVKNRYETLKEIVYAVGMNSRPYFNKKFEMRFGIKPGKLKKRQSD